MKKKTNISVKEKLKQMHQISVIGERIIKLYKEDKLKTIDLSEFEVYLQNLLKAKKEEIEKELGIEQKKATKKK